jgi:hypothetical protein
MLFILSEESLGGGGIGVSQSDLAELTHLGRSKVNASLKALEAGGHIRRRYGSIEVTSAAPFEILSQGQFRAINSDRFRRSGRSLGVNRKSAQLFAAD